jgi:hypothetical protein
MPSIPQFSYISQEKKMGHGQMEDGLHVACFQNLKKIRIERLQKIQEKNDDVVNALFYPCVNFQN